MDVASENRVLSRWKFTGTASVLCFITAVNREQQVELKEMTCYLFAKYTVLKAFANFAQVILNDATKPKTSEMLEWRYTPL